MPFADYDSFDDCVRQNQDKKDPEAYCAEIENRTEDKSMDKETKFDYNFSFKSAKTEDSEKSGRIIEGIASIQELDRDDEIIMMSAFEKSLSSWMKNPVIRYRHTSPVGKGIEAKVKDDKFYVKAYITDKTELGKEVCNLIDEGIVKSFSVAGKILDKDTKYNKDLEKDITYIKDMELYEVTVCDLPANRNSFFSVVSKSLNTHKEKLGSMKRKDVDSVRDESKNKQKKDKQMEETKKEPEVKEKEAEKPKEKEVKQPELDVSSIVKELKKEVKSAVKEEIDKFKEEKTEKESKPVRKAEKVPKEVNKVVSTEGRIKKFVTNFRGPSYECKEIQPFYEGEYYYRPSMVKHAKKQVVDKDLRKEHGFSFKSAWMEKEGLTESDLQKYTYTQTGGPGTAGYALIPVYVDPDIIDRTRRELPMVELIPRRAVKGLTYDYNAITALTNASWLPEDASLADQTDTYDRFSVSMKYLYATGRVTGQAKAGMRGYVDALALEVQNRTLGLKREEDDTIFDGDNTTYPNEFDGLDNLISTNTTALGGALTIASMRTEITQCRDAGGMISLIATTNSVHDDLKALLQDYQRWNNTTQLAWGIETMSFDGIPVIVDRYATSGYMYFLDMSTIFMAVLQDATYEELAKTNDSDKFTIKMYCALVCRAEAFNSILTGIS